MDYSEMLGFTCVKMLYEKNELLSMIYELNHQLQELNNYNEDLLTDNMRITLYNRQNEYNTQKKQIQDRIDDIDFKFNIIIKGILLSFSKTNILEKDLTEKLIYGTI